ncbi:N-acetylglucosamine kinase [Microbacterium sp. AK031]|uniref:N-acetylglucosamine kinase n=1 Tax=Microbacterium sp. AK031 TaxID=2723076 RepID=UPI00216A8027|nr:BadF/BadG/BcrA/BcrD ATPase family protein [Microbacterium sp. AK031]MCS3844979.1 N-acetylglucosamine kinase-like BadF-type ATPase [Microbacterium sp. AK031]
MLTVGVDAGGTSTRAVLATGRGECIGYGTGGRGNPISAGPDRAADGVVDAVARALASSSRTLADVSVITAAMAGQDAEEGEGGWLLARLAAEGFSGRLTFESDLLATYSSGSAEPFGYAIVAGTGASAVRVSGGRIEATADGLGWLLGDRGSGFWIGHRVARAVVRDLDGAGAATSLTGAVLVHLGIGADETRREGRPRSLEQLVASLYGMRPIELAALAPLAFVGDDRVAERILRRAGQHLADSLGAVLTGPGPLVVGGSVLSRSGAVRDAFTERLGDAAAGLEVRPVVDGVVGAGLLALRAAGVAVSPMTLERLSETLAPLR